jgi:hypothetical protein
VISQKHTPCSPTGKEAIMCPLPSGRPSDDSTPSVAATGSGRHRPHDRSVTVGELLATHRRTPWGPR